MTQERIAKKVDEEVLSLLDHFHFCLQTNALNESVAIKEQLDKSMFDAKTYAIYQLLSFRYYIVTKDRQRADQYHNQLNDLASYSKNYLHGEIQFYYTFMKGFYAYHNKDYASALQYYKLSEKHLILIPDNSIKADFYYHFGVLCYHMSQSVKADSCVELARYLYAKDAKFNNQLISCEVIKGLCFTLVQSYFEAEKVFLAALNRVEDTTLRLYLMYNLGYLYAEMGKFPKAIKYLSSVYQQQFGGYKVLYFLTLCHYKLNNSTVAKEFLNEGLALCSEIAEDEYWHHLMMCQLLYDESWHPTLKDIDAEMAYFESNNLWRFAEDYCFELAEKFNKKDDKSWALYFYHKAFESKKNRRLMEAGK